MKSLAQGLLAGKGAKLGSELHFKIHALDFRAELSLFVWLRSQVEDVL